MEGAVAGAEPRPPPPVLPELAALPPTAGGGCTGCDCDAPADNAAADAATSDAGIHSSTMPPDAGPGADAADAADASSVSSSG